MSKKLFLVVLPMCLLFAAGCGGSVSPGVADAPDEPAPELTPDEEATEMESARNAARME